MHFLVIVMPITVIRMSFLYIVMPFLLLVFKFKTVLCMNSILRFHFWKKPVSKLTGESAGTRRAN